MLWANIVKRTLIFALIGIRPLHKLVLGPAFCRYGLSCTEFAIAQLHQHAIIKACWRIGLRLLSCNPFCSPKKGLEK
jgi:putative component of membrane protein insertase Oxa1/YidC/SpoIIIJ protein YidD